MDVGDSFFLASVAAMRGQALLELGQREEAAAEAARARDLAAEDDLDAQSRWRGVQSAVLLARGEPDEAVALARSALDMARSADEPMITARALSDLATALRAAGDETGATASRDEALAIYAAKGDRASFERLTSRLAESRSALARDVAVALHVNRDQPVTVGHPSGRRSRHGSSALVGVASLSRSCVISSKPAGRRPGLEPVDDHQLPLVHPLDHWVVEADLDDQIRREHDPVAHRNGDRLAEALVRVRRRAEVVWPADLPDGRRDAEWGVRDRGLRALWVRSPTGRSRRVVRRS